MEKIFKNDWVKWILGVAALVIAEGIFIRLFLPLDRMDYSTKLTLAILFIIFSILAAAEIAIFIKRKT